MTLRLGVLAGEASGDNLGAGIMVALQAGSGESGESDIRFIGVGGPRMQALGLEVLAPMDQLAVNGLREPLLKLPELIGLMRRLINEFMAADLDAFIGIDFNVFNFLLEAALKRRGLKTAHYVSPSVYAWRAGRTKRIAKSVDLLLCLYPFEAEFYAATTLRTEYVGHPLADEISQQAGSDEARRAARVALDIPLQATVLAVLPGSRDGEVRRMIDHFLDAARRFVAEHEPAWIVIPCLRLELRSRIEQALQAYTDMPVTLYDGSARQALVAADVALVKSGTSTLESMLLHRPMVVSYRVGAMLYLMAKLVMRSPYIALPNILAGRRLVPELLQAAGSGEALSAALAVELLRARQDPAYIEAFIALHNDLRQGADVKAAAAVLRLLRQ